MFLSAKVWRFLHTYNSLNMSFYIPHVWYINLNRGLS